jgi:hypothetical protein
VRTAEGPHRNNNANVGFLDALQARTPYCVLIKADVTRSERALIDCDRVRSAMRICQASLSIQQTFRLEGRDSQGAHLRKAASGRNEVSMLPGWRRDQRTTNNE